MNQFDYDKLWKPYARVPFEVFVKYLEKDTKAEKDVIDQVVLNTMVLLSQGKKFENPCPCGCGMDYIDAHISHYMVREIKKLQGQITQSRLSILTALEKKRLEARQALLVKSDKQMYEAYHGNWSQRNLPTFRRWLRMKD